MKREFLQNIKVGGQPLSKEIIDSIMEEYGKGISAEQAKFSDYETLKANLKTAQDTLAELQKDGATIEEAQRAAKEWEKKYNDAVSDHQREIAERDFQGKLDAAIRKANGKNGRAISALLDLDALRESKNQDADITAAVEACQKENGYLFDDGGTPPPYSPGTGTAGGNGKYTMEQVEAMSMDEYRKYRSNQ